MFDPKERFKLFKLNNHFCAAPWNHLYVHMDGTVKPCTKGKVIGDAKTTSLDDIFINEKYLELRQTILDDKISDNCRKCLKFENTVKIGDFESLRNHYNEHSIYTSIDHTDITQHKLTSVDLHWSSVCDLKCVTCWHMQSSSIAREQGLPTVHTPSKVANEIIDYIVNNQDEIKELYLSGGEPTLIKYNLRLLQEIEKRPDLLVRINSNLQWEQNNAIIQEIIKFPNVMITCSADGIGEKFDYIRRGGSWKKFSENLKFLQSFDHIDIRVNTVFFVLTAQEMPEIIDYFMEEQGAVSHTINQISMEKDNLRSRNLPDNIKQEVRKKLKDALVKYENDLNISGSIKNCLVEIDNPATQDYRDFFDNIDKKQGSNWRVLYPELV